MTMSPDDTKVFAVLHNGNNEGFTRDSVMQFNLSTPWDLTTMSTRIGNTPTSAYTPILNEITSKKKTLKSYQIENGIHF